MAEKGLVDLNKQQAVAPAKYTGSKIDALSVSTDDSPDVPVNNTTDNTQSENSIFVNPNDFNNVSPVQQLHLQSGGWHFWCQLVCLQRWRRQLGGGACKVPVDPIAVTPQ